MLFFNYISVQKVRGNNGDLNITIYMRASLMVQMVKNLPAMQETQVQPLGWGNPLEKGVAIHSSIIAWEIPRTEEPDRI